MNGKPFSSSRRGFSLWVMGAVLGAAAWLSSSASAQSPEAPPDAPPGADEQRYSRNTAGRPRSAACRSERGPGRMCLV